MLNLFPIKFEQVAFHVPNIEAAILNNKEILGLSDWVVDHVKGRVSVFGSPFEPSEAKLAFNYNSDYEYELLQYVSGNNWHKAKGKNMLVPFCSHKSIHVNDMELEKEKYLPHFKLAQEMFTEEHTNTYLLEKKRRYHYAIFDTEAVLGFDLKLIKRIES